MPLQGIQAVAGLRIGAFQPGSYLEPEVRYFIGRSTFARHILLVQAAGAS